MASAQYSAPSEGWIAVPGAGDRNYGVYVFKQEVVLSSISQPMRVWVSGDNRYKLFVNDQIVSIGPARSDIKHWNYEEVDLAPHLHAGNNKIVALIWNEGQDRAVANMTYRTGFFMRGVDKAAAVFNTNSQWRCIEDKSYRPVPVQVPGYYAAGPGERVDKHFSISSQTNDTEWKKATVISGPNYINQSGAFGTYPGWMMKKSELPQRELRLERMAEVRESKNVKVGSGFLKGTAPIRGCCQTNLSGCLCTEPVFMHPIYRIYVAVSLHMSRFFCTFIA